MTQYVVFLRGVNMGGHNKLKMSEVCQRLASLGFDHVASYKQSGNIVLDTADADVDRIAEGIRREIRGLLGKDIEVYLRTMDHVREMVRLDPFRDVGPADARMFVSFLSGELPQLPELPRISPEGDSAIVLILGREVYGVGYPKNGRYGESYGKMVAKLCGGHFTSRNWNTITGIAALHVP